MSAGAPDNCLDCGAGLDDLAEARCQPCRDKAWAAELERGRRRTAEEEALHAFHDAYARAVRQEVARARRKQGRRDGTEPATPAEREAAELAVLARWKPARRRDRGGAP